MDLISFLTIVIVVGVALYLLSIVPMDATLKQVARVIILAFLILWALRVLLGGMTVPLLR